MSYTPSLAWQTWGFVNSAGLGFCLGLIYDSIRIIFYTLTGSDKKHTLQRDIIFMFIMLWSNFLFLLVMCSGRLMLYAFTGEGMGMIVYFYSLSGLIYSPVKSAARGIRRAFLTFFEFFRAKKSCLQLFFIKKFKKYKKISKKLLQIRHYL